MIADTSVTMGSLWLSDNMENGVEMNTQNIDNFESAVPGLPRQQSFEMSDMYTLMSSVSCDASVASSECSDDICLDLEGDDALFCDLQASILNLLDDNSDTSVLCLNNDLTDTEWSCLSNDFDNQSTTSGYSTASSCSSSNISPSSKQSLHERSTKLGSQLARDTPESSSCPTVSTTRDSKSCSLFRRKRLNSHGSEGRKWSHLSNAEQISLVEDLSHVISTELGLREQLDVISIIKPGAKINPTDREFLIDLEKLDDIKLQKIQEYIKLHAEGSQDSPADEKSTVQKKSTKRQKCQERRNQQKIIRQRQRKEYRQMMKERRSGLFVKEEVMALSVATDPGEQDVDVLM